MSRDPNKFRIRKDCPGCDRVFKELTAQDAVLGRLRAIIEGNLIVFNEEIERQKKQISHWEQQADLFQASGDAVSAMKFRAMADGAVAIRIDMLETREKLRGPK